MRYLLYTTKYFATKFSTILALYRTDHPQKEAP